MVRTLVAVVLSLGTAAAAEVVTLSADSYLPFNGDPAAEKPGYMIELAKEVFQAHGMTVTYTLVPWARTLKAVQAGETDGAVGATTDEGLSYPAEPQGQGRNGFITLASSTWAWSGATSLQGVSLGIVSGYTFGVIDGFDVDAYVAAGKGVQVIKGDAPMAIAAEQLTRGRIGAFLDLPPVFMAAVPDPTKYKVAYLAPSAQNLFIAFSPNERGKRLAALLAEGTVALRANGKLAAILARYDLKDWK